MVMARGSQNFVTTVHTASAGDMLELETIRKVVKVINKEAKTQDDWAHQRAYFNNSSKELAKSPRYRVKCQGRGPRTKYAQAAGLHPRAYDRSIPLSVAERMDVYIYQI